ncbi:MAG: type VI secretion system-associated FHA domain protein TagH [Gammaproteobacteria bacterium]
MPLTLRVVRYKQVPPDQPIAISFGPRGGTVGRSPENDLVLDDPKRFVSGQHAAIYRQGDSYQITDTSANGVYINGSARSLGRGNSAVLRDGDSLVLGEYEIEVSASPEDPLYDQSGTTVAPPKPMPVPELDLTGTSSVLMDEVAPAFGPTLEPGPALPPPGRERFVDIGQGGSPLDLYESVPARPATGPAPEPVVSFDDHVPIDKQAFTPPASIPEDWDVSGHNPTPSAGPERLPTLEPGPQTATPHLSGTEPLPSTGSTGVEFDPFTGAGATDVGPAPPAHAPAPPHAASPAHHPASASAGPDGGDSFEAAAAVLLRAAGIRDLHPDSPQAQAIMSRAGTVLVEAIRGLSELLRARSEVKELVRAERTLYWQANNPLKNLSQDPALTLKALLDPSAPGATDPGASVRQVADDLKTHELALIAGMQAAFKSLITRFEPAALERRLQRSTMLNRMLPGTRKARNWDLFVANYEQIASEMEDAMRDILRDEFARAYEREVRALRQFKSGGERTGEA